MKPTLLLLVLSMSAVAAERPRLGVVIIIDQLSAEAFEARAPREKAGLKRLRAGGLSFREALYDSAPTVTAAGHATLSTGTWPEVHGIVANEWVDADTGKSRFSGEDSAYQILGRPPLERDCTAPTWMRVTTLGDSVRANNDLAKAVVISGKDRSAIATAGSSATAAIWFDIDKPIFVTSNYYTKNELAWLKPINETMAQWVVKNAFAWSLPAGGITGQSPKPVAATKGDDDVFYERAQIQSTIDRLEVDVAAAALTEFSLGKDDVPDLLTISFSGHDRIGHRFGPDAPESLAEYDNIDLEIGRLLVLLDKSVGKNRYTVVLTADHGVAPLPEVLKARGIDAGRVDTKALKAALEKTADDALGNDDWFLSTKVPGVNANPKNRQKLQGLFEKLKKTALAQPGVLDFYSTETLLNKANPTSVERHYLKGIFPGRSPDFLVVTKPYWLFGTGDSTGHVSTYHYDSAVPLVWFGAGITQGKTNGRAEAIDVAPTMAALLGVPPPAASQGRVLPEVVH